MQPLSGSGRGTRLSLLGLALLVLLSVVAFASRSGLGHRVHAVPSPGYVNYAVTIFLILFVLMIPVAIYAFSLRIRELAEAPRRTGKARLLGSAARFATLFLVAFVVYDLRHRAPNLFQHVNPFHLGQAGGTDGHGRAKPEVQPRFEWNVLWAFLVLLAATTAVGYYRWKTGRLGIVPGETEPTASEDLAATITDTIGDLEAEPDARRAVIAAYARMEAVLGRHGFQRGRSETAIEYLRRILLGLTSRRDAVVQLTTLFEQAKFSRNEIDDTMKNEAIGALRELRDGLAGAPV